MNLASDTLTREDYESQLAEGFRWLRFRPALEAEFQALHSCVRSS